MAENAAAPLKEVKLWLIVGIVGEGLFVGVGEVLGDVGMDPGAIG